MHAAPAVSPKLPASNLETSLTSCRRGPRKRRLFETWCSAYAVGSATFSCVLVACLAICRQGACVARVVVHGVMQSLFLDEREESGPLSLGGVRDARPPTPRLQCCRAAFALRWRHKDGAVVPGCCTVSRFRRGTPLTGSTDKPLGCARASLGHHLSVPRFIRELASTWCRVDG